MNSVDFKILEDLAEYLNQNPKQLDQIAKFISEKNKNNFYKDDLTKSKIKKYLLNL